MLRPCRSPPFLRISRLAQGRSSYVVVGVLVGRLPVIFHQRRVCGLGCGPLALFRLRRPRDRYRHAERFENTECLVEGDAIGIAHFQARNKPSRYLSRLGEAGLGETKLLASFPHGLAEATGKPDDV